MKRTALAAVLALIAPRVASADCQDDVAKSYDRANAMAPSFGRAALLEQIQRAEIAHHEGDEGACQEELSTAAEVLNNIDAARREQSRTTAKPDGSG